MPPSSTPQPGSQALSRSGSLQPFRPAPQTLGQSGPPAVCLATRDCWIFDMDGTLTLANHDFEAIRISLGLPAGQPILESLAQLPPAEAAPLHARLDEIELEIARTAKPQPGAAELLDCLRSQNKKLGLLTRNSLAGAHATLAASGLAHFFEPGVMLSRHCCAPKPSPQGIQRLLAGWQTQPSRGVMVGDYHYDLQAGRRAGTATVHLDVSGVFPWPEAADVRVSHLDELRAIVDLP